MDIRIGEKTGICSAMKIGHYQSKIYIDTDISENSKEYWASSKLLEVSIHINKETPEGKKLKAFIESDSAKKANNFLDTIALRHMPIREFKHKIEELKRESFTEGKEAAQRNFRSALGL